ncbi:anti-sigma factor domain-containing protein [Georgenia sp. Z1344]|uniref:anti-sigma factor n=1 Tax=Georgenia sp. Z1344 TaxID=3416706 RepID=UPI003CED5102
MDDDAARRAGDRADVRGRDGREPADASDDVDALLHAWALDAVDDAERARVERAVEDDPELAAEARALRETAALLASAGSIEPPATLRDHVLDAAARTPQERDDTDTGSDTAADGTPVAPADDPGEHRGAREPNTSARGGAAGDRAGDAPRDELAEARRRRRLPRVLVAAAAAVALVVTGAIAVQQYRRAEEARDEIAAIHDLLASPGSELVVAEVAGGGTAGAVVADGEAVFVAAGLPELDDDRDYQLWVIDAAGAQSAGVLTSDDGRARTEVPAVDDGDTLGVTVEPAGGSDAPTTDPIVTLAGG